MVDADTDPAGVGPQVVHPIGDGPPEARQHEVMHADRRGLPLGGPFPPAILEGAHQFLLLGVDRDRRLPSAQAGPDPGVDVLELRVAVGVVRPFDRLPVGLQAVAQLVEQLRHHPMAGAVPLPGQFRGQPADALARPAQGRLRIPARGRLDQRLQVRDQRRILLDRPLAPAARAADPAGRQRPRPARRQLLRPDPNGPPGHAGGPRDQRHPAAALRPRPRPPPPAVASVHRDASR